jgi:RsiW-degrading membrane proteinase PrsW (M82 family)
MEEGVKMKSVEKTSVVQSSGKEAPVMVKIISVLYYICLGIYVLSALVFIVGGIILVANPTALSGIEQQLTGVITMFASMMGIVFLVAGIVAIPLAILCFFIARGLRRGKGWTRIIVIVFGILALIGSIFQIISGTWSYVVPLLIEGVIAGYLLFSKDAKEFFAK